MSYKVKVAEWVADILRNLPRTIRVQVRQRLFVDLPADPDGQLGSQVIPFAHKYEFHVTGTDTPQQPPVGFWFVFVVDRGTADELHVESCRDANNPNPN